MPEYNTKLKNIHAHFLLRFPQMSLQMAGPSQLDAFYFCFCFIPCGIGVIKEF